MAYSYDNGNRLAQITQGTSSVSFGYDNANRRSTLTLPNGIVASYSYDNGSQMTGITYQLGATTLGNLTYAYDLAGRRTSLGGSFARTGLPLPVNITSYNAANQLTQWGTATLTYDANGNMLSSGSDGYAWDARNRLVSTLSGASFQYDPFGRRVGKTISGTTTNYLYDGANIVQELSGGVPRANLLSGGVDEVFTRTDSSGAMNFLTDALGSALALADSAGTTQAQYTYDPFGNTTITGNSTNPFQYTGRENDGTGLYFYRARYYNPALQRFISEDPIESKDGMTMYGYARNNPVRYVDPDGRCSQLTAWWPPCKQLLDNKATDQKIFDITKPFFDPWLMKEPGGVELAQIHTYEQYNLWIDEVALNLAPVSLLTHIPGFPDPSTLTEDLLRNLQKEFRDRFNKIIDDLLQKAAEELGGRYSGRH